jgi:hypothetical protein
MNLLAHLRVNALDAIKITDPELYARVERCARERASCMVVADASFKYLQNLERVLEQTKGDAQHSAGRFIRDSWPLSEFLACLGMVQGEPPFDRPRMIWHYERADGGIVIHFDPC